MKYLVGIQPTGRLHIGNYLGCIKEALKLQNEGHEVIFMIAQYHSLTTGGADLTMESQLRELGCDCVVYQSPEILEQFFAVCCRLNLGSLLRMPQYKDKKNQVEYDLGLLLYPALMAADIFHFDPDFILVGEDQVAHIELTNDIAPRMGINKAYQYQLSTSKVPSLIDPTKKMSKSLGERHVLYLKDNYEAKLQKANGSPEGRATLDLIARGIDVDPDQFEMNVDLKLAIATAMREKFGGL